MARRITAATVVLAMATLGLAGTGLAHEGKHGMAASGETEVRAMDKDKDGKLSRAEHAAGAHAMFVTMDADKDGSVSAAEMDAAQATLKGQTKGATKGQTKDQSKGDGARMSSAAKIAVIDANKDGALSTAEHETGSRRMFDQMDTDKDEFLTAKEIQFGHDDMMSQRASP